MDFPSPSKRKLYSFNNSFFKEHQTNVKYEYDKQRFNDSCIIIDNGSFLFRAGWSHDPLYKLCFQPYVSRSRGKVSVGSEALKTKDRLKTPFHQDVIYASKPMEDILDHTFNSFSINEPSIPNPVFITEAPFTPSFSRGITSELLFECYQVPHTLYGIDSMCSLYHNTSMMKNNDTHNKSHHPFPKDALIIRSGLHRTHVMPFLDGKIVHSKVRSTPIGGHLLSEYLLQLLRLKYPQHYNEGLLTTKNKGYPLSKIDELKKSCCRVSPDYFNEIKKFSKEESYFHKKTIFSQLLTTDEDNEDNNHDDDDIINHSNQLVPPPPLSNNKDGSNKTILSPEELEKKKKRRQEIFSKMREKLNEQYEMRIKKEGEDLTYFEYLLNLKKTNPELFKTELQRIGFSESDLTSSYNTLKKKITNREKRKASKLKSSSSSKKKKKKKKKKSPPPTNLQTITLKFVDHQKQKQQPIKISKKRDRVEDEEEEEEEEEDVIILNNEGPRKKKSKNNSVLFNENLKTSNPEKWLEEVRKLKINVLNDLNELSNKNNNNNNNNNKKNNNNNNKTFYPMSVSQRRTKRKAATQGRLKQITQTILSSQKKTEEQRILQQQLQLQNNNNPNNPKIKKKRRRKKKAKTMEEKLKKRRKRKKKGKKEDRMFYETNSSSEEDLFGLDDDDWNIYRKMNEEETVKKDRKNSDLIETKEKRRYLGEIEIAIANMEMRLYNKSLNQAKQNHYMRQYQHLRIHGEGRDRQDYLLEALNAQLREEERYQMHLTIERIRVTETLFSPSFIGKKCCGLEELIQLVINDFIKDSGSNCKKIERMTNHVYLCGGNLAFLGMKKRIYSCLRSLLHPSCNIKIFQENNSRDDCWIGMKDFYRNLDKQSFNKMAVSKQEYFEHGFQRAHFIKGDQCWLSNMYLQHQNIPVLVKQQLEEEQQQQQTISSTTIVPPPPLPNFQQQQQQQQPQSVVVQQMFVQNQKL